MFVYRINFRSIEKALASWYDKATAAETSDDEFSRPYHSLSNDSPNLKSQRLRSIPRFAPVLLAGNAIHFWSARAGAERINSFRRSKHLRCISLNATRGAVTPILQGMARNVRITEITRAFVNLTVYELSPGSYLVALVVNT